MAFYEGDFVIVTDSLNNIYMFQRQDERLDVVIFDYETEETEKKTVAEDILEEYDVSIDKYDIIYITYQNTDYNLMLTTFTKSGLEEARLTESPIPIIYNLNTINYNDDFHIIYCIESFQEGGVYRIYHHLYNGIEWQTREIDKIKAFKLLNPFQIIKNKEKLFISYYDYEDKENIYIKRFNQTKNKWEDKIQLTDSGNLKLYLDLLIIKDKIHLVYSKETDGNFAIMYERFSLDGVSIEKEKKKRLSNIENCSHPTTIYFDEKLWVIWVEYDKILSRYSQDMGQSWSPIYLWNESKEEDIIRYKYVKNEDGMDRILNKSFGTTYPDISFVGFGPLEDVTEVPLKKNLPPSIRLI